MKESKVDMDVSVSEVNFVASSSGVLAENVSVSGLGIVGLRSVDLRERPYAAAAGRFEAVNTSLGSGTFTLLSLRVSAGTWVSLAKGESPQEYRIVLNSADTSTDVVDSLVLSIARPVDVDLRGTASEPVLPKRRLQGPERVTLRFQTRSIELDLAVPKGAPVELSTNPLDIKCLDFSSRSLALISPLPADRCPPLVLQGEISRSSVLAGTVAFAELKRDAYQLRPTDRLTFDQSSGSITRNRFQNDQIQFSFYGGVRGMMFGPVGSERTLMPTRFEWLRSGYPFAVFWIAAGYCLAMTKLLMGVLPKSRVG